MKILFVCGCLEPGRDGVGDYTRRLAAEIAARGHSSFLLSLADAHVQKATLEDSGATGITSSLRLPAIEPWPERVRQAKNFCESISPDWVSWQIVLYGFDPRGLSFGLGRRFRDISGGCRNQIMFHELWIGEAEQSSLKFKIIGKVQKFIIKDVLSKLSPPVVHTHTPLYQHLLGRLGYQAEILPLFGNIPLTTQANPEWLKQKWPDSGVPFPASERLSWWVFVVFGTIHPEWDADDFVQRASAAAERAGKKCLFISIGRLGAVGEQKVRELQKYEGDSWRFLNLGPQSEEDVSQCLLAADFGISAVPPEYIFKSGTAAAMIERGLPIIATRPPYRYAHFPPEKLAIGMRNVVSGFDLEPLKKSTVGSLLPAVADQFIQDLSSD